MIVTRFRRLACLAAAATGLALSACDDSGTDPGRPLDLAMVLLTAGGSGSAFDKADEIGIVLRDGNVVVFDEAFPFTSKGTDASLNISLDPSLAGKPLAVEAALRWQGADLFFGTGSATPGAGSSGNAEITLQPIPHAILLDEPPTLTALGASIQLAAAAVFATGDTVRDLQFAWTLLDPDVITLSADGVATAAAEGQARVRASAGIVSAEATVHVRRAVAAIDVTQTVLALGVGTSRSVGATPRAANGDELAGRTVAWSSDDPSIVDVALPGPMTAVAGVPTMAILTGRAPGVTRVRAVSEGVEAVIDVVVTITPVAMVPITPMRANVPVGGMRMFQAEPLDETGSPLPGRSITWQSADPGIATVSGSGNVVTVTGHAPGSTTIIAMSEGRSGVVPVVVGASTVPMAWAYVDPDASEYGPAGTNLTGGTMYVDQLGDGLYLIEYDGLGLGGLGTRFIAQVSAETPLSGAGVSCHANSMDINAPLTLQVLCIDQVTRRPADGQFSAVIMGDNVLGGSGAPSQRAFFSMHLDPQGGGPYTPQPGFSWNSAGAAMTVFPTGGEIVHTHGETMRSPFAVFATQIQPAGDDECVIRSASATAVSAGCHSPTGGFMNLPHKVLGFEKGRPGGDWGFLTADPACVRPGPASTTVELDAQDAAGKGVLKSVASGTPAEVEFVNDACEPVDLFWIDYSGTLSNYGRLQPGEIRVQGTFVTHPWLAVGLVSGDIAIYQPVPGRAVARIQPVTSSSGPVRYERTGTGMYTVTFLGSDVPSMPAVLLSPRATGFAACTHRITALTPVTIDVVCRGPGAQLEDHGFSLAWLR